MIDDEKKELLHTIDSLRKRVRELETGGVAHNQTLTSLRPFEKTFETMQLGVTLCDLNRKIIYTNPAEAEMHGYTVEELIGQDARIFAPENLWHPLESVPLDSIKRWKRESTNKRKDGSIFPVQIMSDIVTDEEGKPIGFVTTCENITRRVKAEEDNKALIRDLEEIITKVKVLSGLLPICASCKKIRDDKGYWNQLEDYIHKHSDAEFTHGICPECVEKLYAPAIERAKKKNKEKR